MNVIRHLLKTQVVIRFLTQMKAVKHLLRKLLSPKPSLKVLIIKLNLTNTKMIFLSLKVSFLTFMVCFFLIVRFSAKKSKNENPSIVKHQLTKWKKKNQIQNPISGQK